MDTDLSTPSYPWSAHMHAPSIDSTLNLDSSQSGSIGSIRTQSSTSRAGKGHNYGASINTQPDGRNPSEYAMHHLLNAFVMRADQMISLCLTQLDSVALPVEEVCGAGADPAFDQLLVALGHVTRQQPKNLVDSLMLWRQNKADSASASRKLLASHRSPSAASQAPMSLIRRNTEPVSDPANMHPGVPVSGTLQPDELSMEEYANLDKQATVSIFILCRGLMEVFDQSSLEAITPELASKLEDIVFEQLKAFEPHHLNTNKIRSANWKVYGHLLGRMSRLDFARVVGRFIQQLKLWLAEIATSAGTTAKAREVELRIELLLTSMQHVRLSTDPAHSPQTCDFLNLLAQCFANAHGPRIKQAFCAAMESFLLQIASRPDITERDLKFKDFVDLVNPRINQMLTKMRHWAIALPTSISLLCLSSMDIFNVQWMPQMNALATKLREKGTRTPAMRAICQLLWTYLNRTTESPIVRARKVEEIVKLVLPPGRKPHISTEASMAEATLCFIRLLGLYHPDLCYRMAIFPLVNPESVLSSKDLRTEQLDPEKITIGIRAFLLVMEDREKGLSTWATFPEFETALPTSDAVPSSPMPFALLQATEPQVPVKRKEFHFSLLPINSATLDDPSRAAYNQFCDLLGRITVFCDNTFGSSATLNEKFSGVTPKTPLVDAFTLSRRDGDPIQDQKNSYYELLMVAIQALPRCLSDNLPLTPLINLLCTASAHVQNYIAAAATESLKAIASQGYAQVVATAFPRFIFNYDHQYSTMSDEGRLGASHIETTLTLYLDLLRIWIAHIEKKAIDSVASRALQMEMTAVLSLVDEIEGYGLFFLCSQSRRARDYAIKVLELVLHFDRVLGKDDQIRIIKILDTHSERILDFADESLNVFERSRLQKDRNRRVGRNILIELSNSENSYDSALWFKVFPNVVRYVFEMCPQAAALSREFVCDRLALMLPDIERLASTAFQGRDMKLIGRSSDTPIDVFVDQWKLYLIMACVTLSSTGGQSRGQLDNVIHTRKASRNASGLQDKLTSARALFSAVIPLLGSSSDAIRSAVVTALGSINRKLYRILLESLQYAVITCNDEAKLARRGAHQRTPSSPSRSQMTERMRTEVTFIYKLTATFLRHEEILRDEWILANLMNYAKDLRLFLSDGDIHSDWKFSRLRYHYCGLVDIIYDNIKRTTETSIYMSFESRKSAFMLMEEWCGYSESQGPFWPDNDFADKSSIIAKERISLRTGALSAMATLCAGPVSVVTETNTLLQFNVSRMLSWIDSVLTSREHRLHEIGQRALKNLIVCNANNPIFFEHAIQGCYGVKGPVALENCFRIVVDVLMQQPNFPVSDTKVLAAIIFTLGHDSQDIRIRSAKLLRFLDEREQKSSNLQHFDISISDRTRAVYKAAQFEYSRRLSQNHPSLAFHVFSEFCLQFRNVSTDIQRGMVAAILPWLQTLELQVLPESNNPTDLSHMLLVNMVEITTRSGIALHNEVQALWQALATGPYGGNVQLILDFVIDLALERREQNFIYCAKQIVVCLSVTPAGSRIFEHLLLQLAAKNMTNERRSSSYQIPDTSHLPYVANLEKVLPVSNRQASFSLGQISLILLVDLLVPPMQVEEADALKLLHAVFILWDHHTPTVQEHAREMLVHLMHTLVIGSIDNSSVGTERLRKTEELVEAVRGSDVRIGWSYGDLTGKSNSEGSKNRIPAGMSFLAQQIVDIFSSTFEDLNDAWAKEALHWASVCPVRHLACRSFQVFRCISVKLDSALLSDMLARLSNTIADEHADYQTFSLEILTTLKVVIAALDTKGILKYPQLMWTTAACLDTIHEAEFSESLAMLEQMAQVFDFADPLAIDAVIRAQPSEWEGTFEGFEPLLYKGMRSSQCFERTIAVLGRLMAFPDSRLIGTQNRLLFNTLGYLPFILEGLKNPNKLESCQNYVQLLVSSAHAANLTLLETTLFDVFKTGTKPIEVYIKSVLASLREIFFPAAEAETLIFVLGLLANATKWYRINVLEILCHLIPLIDMQNPNITSHGADLVSPLLRLLQTDLCHLALRVMDQIMQVSVTPMEKQHLRMSMASGVARATRKEYERTQSLYGIPEISGWSIPTPAILSAQTRSNVHHVFFACSETIPNGETAEPTPEIEFHAEEEYNDSYFPSQEDSVAYSSFESANDISMGDIMSSLDSLDDFFDENDSPTTPTGDTRASGGLGSFSFFDGDHQTNVYDQQTAPLISRTLNRSSASFNLHNGLAESRPPSSQSQHHRTQYSISSSANAYQTSFESIDEDDGPGPSMPWTDTHQHNTSLGPENVTHRPTMHARSITSPANQYPSSHPTSGSAFPPLLQTYNDGPQTSDEVFSDPENSPFPKLGSTVTYSGTRSVNVTPTSATDASGNFMRRGMRRLTGGRSESAKEKARLRAPSTGQNQYSPIANGPGNSPRIPRIPAEFLGNTNASNANNNTPSTGPSPMSP